MTDARRLLDAKGIDLEVAYTQMLVGLAREPGVIGTIYRKAQNRIQDPAKLHAKIGSQWVLALVVGGWPRGLRVGPAPSTPQPPGWCTPPVR